VAKYDEGTFNRPSKHTIYAQQRELLSAQLETRVVPGLQCTWILLNATLPLHRFTALISTTIEPSIVDLLLETRVYQLDHYV